MRWLVAFFFLLAPVGSATAQETRIAAVINDDIVTIDDLAGRMRLITRSSGIEDTPQNQQRVSGRVLRSLIDEKLELQEAKRLNVAVSQQEIDAALQRIETQNKMPKGGLDDFLSKAGIPRSTLIGQVTAAIGWSKVIRARLAQEVTISDEEVNEQIARLKENADQPANRVAEIFLAVDNPNQEEEAHRLADRLIEQIRGGANFGAVAQQFSQAPSAAVGGDIGWVTADQLNPTLATAIERMKPGEMSYPIRTPGGFYMLYLVDRKLPGASSADQTELSLTQVIFPLSATASPEERQRAEAEARAVTSTAKSCGEMQKIGRERAPQLSGEIADVKAADLPPELRRIILGLKLAEASPPLPLRGGVGVVMICQRKDPPAATPTHDEVYESLARERLDALARRYLRDLRRSAFVDIRG